MSRLWLNATCSTSSLMRTAPSQERMRFARCRTAGWALRSKSRDASSIRLEQAESLRRGVDLQELFAHIGEALAADQVELDDLVRELAHRETEQRVGATRAKADAQQIGLEQGLDDEVVILNTRHPAVLVQPFAREVIARQYLVVAAQVDDDFDHAVRQYAFALVPGGAARPATGIRRSATAAAAARAR